MIIGIISLIVFVVVFMEAYTVLFHGKIFFDSNSEFIEKKLSRPCISSKGCIHFWYYDFIAKADCICFKWYVQGQGVVWRWSKVSREIDKKYNQLRKTQDMDMKTVQLKP